MAKTYKLVTTLSDGTEIDAGTFEVPDASLGTHIYQHQVVALFDPDSSLGGGGFSFTCINTSSTKLTNWDDLYNALKSYSNFTQYCAIVGYFGPRNEDHTWFFFGETTSSDENILNLIYNIEATSDGYKATTIKVVDGNIINYKDAVVEII